MLAHFKTKLVNSIQLTEKKSTEKWSIKMFNIKFEFQNDRSLWTKYKIIKYISMQLTASPFKALIWLLTQNNIISGLIKRFLNGQPSSTLNN